MAKTINKEAWDLLRRDEQMSLSLSLAHGKSSWESGEIMKKAHYKFLEINARAEKFLRMFTEYFEVHKYLTPASLDVPQSFKEYLSLVVLSRLTVRDAIEKIDDPQYKVSSFRDKVLDEILRDLSKPKEGVKKDLFDILLEFDRWNNFRVLPKYWQQPSAFKRRNKSKELKFLKVMSALPSISIEKITEIYEFHGQRAKSLWIPLVSKVFPERYKVLQVKNTTKAVDQLTRMGFLLFDDPIYAQEFGVMVMTYIFKRGTRDNSHVMVGLNFWGKYRDHVKLAINYGTLINYIPNRKFMEDARIDEGVQLRKKLKARETSKK